MRFLLQMATLVWLLGVADGRGHAFGAQRGKPTSTCLSGTVVAAVLSDRDVRGFLHVELADRVPVLVSGRGLTAATIIPALEFPVQVVEGKDSAAARVLQFRQCRRSRDRLEVKVILPIEGMSGSLVLVPNNQSWVVQTCRLVER